MDSSLRDYHLRPPSRGRSRSRADPYLDTSEYNEPRDVIAPTRSRASTPSAAVRRAMQVLEDTYRQQSYLKSDRWSRSADQGSMYNRPIRARRSPSPIRSRSHSPIRRSPTLWQPSRLVELERDNFQDALDDSESRRELLLKKLADAQQTMEIQNDRLRDGEMDVNECKATIRLLQQVQQELETKTQFLQKERESFLAKSKHDAEEKETQRRKIDELNRESNRLRCQLELMLADKHQHHVTLEHLHKSIGDFKQQVKNISEAQSTTTSELGTAKERLNVARQRGELLEKEKNHAFSELEKNQKTQQALINRNTDLGQRLSRCQSDLQVVSEQLDKTNYEYGHQKEEFSMCRDKMKKQGNDLVELRRSHMELQSDRERALKYNNELEKTLHSIKEINQELKQTKVTLEDDNTELHADLAKTRLELAKVAEDNASNKNQLAESRKNCKQLTKEVLQLRPEVEELERKLKEMEGTHKMDVQKGALQEAQKSQLTCEKEDALTKLSTLRESFENLEKHHEEEMKKMSKDIAELRHDKDRATAQFRDAQAQYTRIKEELDMNNQHTQAQLDHWRQACSKLTSLIEEKEHDLSDCVTQRREAEESLALEEAQRRTIEIQLNDVQVSNEELNHLRSEQKRLSQECAENQQMITVLEMQRDILAKSPSKSNPSENISQPQIEKLQAELALMKAKLQQTETERDSFLKNRNKLAREIPVEPLGDVTTLKGINQMLAEQLTQARQETETLQTLLEEKTRAYERDVRELTREKQRLDLRMASMSDELNALQSDQSRRTMDNTSELKGMKAEMLWMEQDLKEKNQEVTILKGEWAILENGKKRAEDRVKVLEDLLEEMKTSQANKKASPDKKLDDKSSSDLRIKTAKLEAAEAENAVLQMQLVELESLKTSHNTMIGALKKQLERNGASSSDSDSSGSGNSLKAAAKEIKSLKRDLQRAIEEIGVKEKHISDLKKKFVESQRLEQRARQERDELQGKAIIMESLNDSSQDLLKELEETREEKSNLEKQLTNFLTTKTSQTLPTSLSIAEDLDRELENQYRTVCERNKWLETRIASLQREIELVRDQNTLLQEQRNNAERETAKLQEQLRDLQMTSKGTRRQGEVEQIHLQHSNAEKMQKILDLERELSEKKQLIRAMTKEIESLHKKADKGKISSFMKKLRRSSDSGSHSFEKKANLSKSFNDDNALNGRSGFGSPPSTLDPGYSTLSLSQTKPKRSSSLSPTSRSSSFGGFPKVSRNSFKSTKSNNVHLMPLSPTLTYVTAIDDVTDPYTPSTGKRSPSRPREDQLSPARVSFDESSDHEVRTPSSRGRSRSEGSSPRRADEDQDGAFYAEDYLPEDQHQASIRSPIERISQAPFPDEHEPHPEELGDLPTPTSSPSLPSPSSAGRRGLSAYVVRTSDDSDHSEDHTSVSGSEDKAEVSGNPGSYPRPMRAIAPEESSSLLKPNISHKSNSHPQRPRSQPTFKETDTSPVAHANKKKRSSLV